MRLESLPGTSLWKRAVWLVASAALWLATGCGREDSEGRGESPGPVPVAEFARESGAARWWVWHRPGGPAQAEPAAWRAAGVRNLYWHAADFGRDPSGGEVMMWRALARPVPVEGMALVPVARVDPGGAFLERLEDPAVAAAFFGLDSEGRGFVHRAGETSPGIAGWEEFPEVQIDYDCPARLLVAYAGVVARLKEKKPGRRVSVTALASWIDAEGFGALAKEADELFPMFYDLEADTQEDARAGRWHPIADPAAHRAWIRKWSACPAPWVAGFPNFSRVSVFAPDGTLRGHLRSWSWDELVFHPDLDPDTPRENPYGVTSLTARRDTRLAGVAVEAGDRVVVRMPDRDVLASLAEDARRAGAGDVCWFLLPGPGVPAAWSLSQIATGGTPQIAVEIDSSGVLVARNAGTGDLPPRFHGRAGTGDRGWKIEIEAATPGAFAGVSPGGFAQCLGHWNPEAEDTRPVHPAHAKRLTFWFSHLLSGESLRSGRITLSAPHTPQSLRWRFDGGDWQSIP